MPRKIIYYLKGSSRNIVITDHDEELDEDALINDISKKMATNKIACFETDADVILVRPTELMAIHVQKSKIKQKYSFGNNLNDALELDDEETENDVNSSIVDNVINEAADLEVIFNNEKEIKLNNDLSDTT